MFRSLYLFLVIFPFLIVPFHDYVTVVKMGIFAYFCLAIWIYFFLKTKKQKSFPTEKKLYRPELFLFMFAFWAALSALFSQHPYVALFGTVTRHEGILALYSYFTVFLIASRFAPIDKYKQLLTGLVGISMISSLYGLFQKFPPPFLPFIDGTERVDSFYGNPNFYGSYLVMMLLLAMILMMTIHKKKVLFFIAADFLFLNILFSGTRSALVGVFTGLFCLGLFIWFKSPGLRKRYWLLLISFVLLFGAVNLLAGNSYLDRVVSIAKDAGQAMQDDDQSGAAGSGRWKLWEIALPLVTKNPVFGSGPDTLRYVFDQDAYRRYTKIPDIIVDKAHNEYLQIAITMGIPSLVFYLLFLSAILRGIWKSMWKSEGEQQLFLAGFFALIIAYAVQAFFNISVVPVAPFFWFILGIGARWSQGDEPGGRFLWRTNRVFACNRAQLTAASFFLLLSTNKSNTVKEDKQKKPP